MSASDNLPVLISAPRSVKSLTCFFWAETGTCRFSAEECLYAHYWTGRIADGPTRREAGRPAVAGKNAFKDRPIYQNWRAIHQDHQNRTNNELNRQLQHIRNKAQAQSQAVTRPTHNMVHGADLRGESADGSEPVFGISGSVNFSPAVSSVDLNEQIEQSSRVRQVTPSSSASTLPANELVRAPTKQSNILELQAHFHRLFSTKDAIITQMSHEIDNLTAHLQGQRKKLDHEIRKILQVVHNYPVEPSPYPPVDAISPPYGRPPTHSERLLMAALNMTQAMRTSAVLLKSMQETKADISSRLEDLGEGYLVAHGWSRQRGN